MEPLALQELIQSNPTRMGDLLRLIALIGLVGGVGNSHSESVYRCGNSYSSSSQCASERATEVNAHSEPGHHVAAPKAMAAREQREADALEKKRLQAERQAVQQQPVQVVISPPQTSASSPSQSSRHGAKHPKPPNPYFTAKDPNKPAKKPTND